MCVREKKDFEGSHIFLQFPVKKKKEQNSTGDLGMRVNSLTESNFLPSGKTS